MNQTHISKIADEQSLSARQVQATVELLDEAATVPFIARYRKEATGGLDEVAIIAIRDRIEQLRALDKRREAILNSLQEQGKLNDELKAKVMAAETLAVLEDIYLPYRPKRRTRGSIAKEKGLEPLAALLFEQGEVDPEAEAARFIDLEKEVGSAEDALAGARDIIAEWVNEDGEARAELRELFGREAFIRCEVIEGKEAEAAKYKDYFDWQEPLDKAPSHRILAILRGAKEEFLTYAIGPEEQKATSLLERRFVKGDGPASQQVKEAVHDSYKRLLSPSLETEMRQESKKRADEEAIKVFAENLRELLLAPPLGQKNVLAIDPGYRTGCKVVCLDRQGKLLHHDTIFPLEPRRRTKEAAEKIEGLVAQYNIEAIAVGNGAGGREALAFCRSLKFDRKIPVEMVNESGASVYSASEAARDEFSNYDVTVRGTVSIGRRLMDPLAELVKIDAKSIGVGQYQHDVDQNMLKKSLDDVVSSCVNAVGVEANTASKQLLSYVSGLGLKLAGSIVAYRDEHGPFQSREDFLGVPGMGPKTFEQAAGFLRIREGKNPLDASAVHPESYPVVEAMAADLGCTVVELMQKEELRQKIELKKYVTAKVGMPTLNDIMAELAKPGRDPRKQFEAFDFAEHVHEISDLEPGMRLPGVVTNVTNFGAFIDVGVHQDGLAHISELADHFVERPADVVKVHQKVTVTVLGVDLERNRIALSLRSNPDLVGDGSERKAKSEGRPSRPKHRRPKGRQEPKPRNNPFAEFFKNRKLPES